MAYNDLSSKVPANTYGNIQIAFSKEPGKNN